MDESQAQLRFKKALVSVENSREELERFEQMLIDLPSQESVDDFYETRHNIWKEWQNAEAVLEEASDLVFFQMTSAE